MEYQGIIYTPKDDIASAVLESDGTTIYLFCKIRRKVDEGMGDEESY